MDSRNAKAAARRAIEQGCLKHAADLLAPLVRASDPEALFLFATFSSSDEESARAFEARSLNLLQKSAEQDYPPALYALGICYDLGDLVRRDELKAGRFFESAANLGYPKAKYEHGRNLYYGSHGFEKKVGAGWKLIQDAATEQVEDAVAFIREFGGLQKSI